MSSLRITSPTGRRAAEHGRPGCAASGRLACSLRPAAIHQAGRPVAAQARTPVLRSARTRDAALLVLALSVFSLASTTAAEVIPPKPAGYFSDNANVVSEEAALRFNEQLAQFERETSNQILVAVFRKMETDSSIEDYTQRIAQSWGAGQADRRNGAVLFVFIDDRKMFIQVGYGLEGVLPDVTAFDITERNIKPRFRTQDYEGGLATGIDLMLKAIRGEYRGTGKTVRESGDRDTGGSSFLLPIFFGLVMMWIVFRSRKSRRRRGWGYSGHGGPFIGGWSSGSSSGGGFSGFSGGGGSFGGGGAGSSW